MRFKFMFFLSFLILSSGCASISIDLGETPDRSATYYEYHDGWGLGFVSEGRAVLAQACPRSRIAFIRNYTSFEDGLLGLFLSGIYMPHTTQITCAAEVKNAAK